MRRFALVIVFVGAVLAAVVLLASQRALTKLRRENQDLQRQLGPALQRAAETRQPAGRDVPVGNASGLPEEQFHELLRLRGEVAVLRREEKETAQPHAEAAVSRKREPGPTFPASQIYLPKESWSFAGCNDPSSALQSLLWASGQSDPKTLTASFTFAHRAAWGRRTDAEIAAQVSKSLSVITGFQVLEQKTVAEDTVILILSPSAELGKQLKLGMRFKRVGTDWKFDGEARAD